VPGEGNMSTIRKAVEDKKVPRVTKRKNDTGRETVETSEEEGYILWSVLKCLAFSGKTGELSVATKKRKTQDTFKKGRFRRKSCWVNNTIFYEKPASNH